MKKYILIFFLTFSISLTAFTQGNVDIMVENPRVVTVGGFDYFYFDIYARKTDTWGSGAANEQELSNSSFYFNWNEVNGSNPTLVTYNTTVFPASGYVVTVGTTGAGGFKLYVDVAQIAPGFQWVTNEIYFLFTVGFRTNSSSNLSEVAWLFPDTGLTHFRFSTSGISLTETDYSSGCDLAMDTKSWTGANSGDWDNANNWSPSGVPSGVDMIYPNNPTTHLSGMAVSAFGDIQNLRVNHLAEMPIPQNCGVTASGNVTLMGGARNIICEAGTGVGTASSAFIPEGTINYNGYVIEPGHIEVHRTLYYTSTSGTYYMHQVAAPVSGVILDDWDMVHFNTYAYEWSTLLQDWWNIYVPSRSTPPGYGFILSLYDLGTSSTEDVIFYDNLVLTDVTPTFTLAADEYALLGNPYTAPIDWDVMNPETNIYNSVWVWNPASGNYASYVEGSGGNASAHYIQPGQSFFIQASGAATQFAITTAARTQNIEPYLKEELSNLLRIFTEGGNETWDESYIRFKEGSVTPGYDANHDAHEWPSGYGDAATEIYTVGSDDVKMSIDARPMITDEESSVPLSFKAAMGAEYKLHADEESMSSFFPSIKIMLEDTFFPEQDWIDMRVEGSYTFDAAPGDPPDRFILHFWDTEFGIEDSELAQAIQIYSDRTDAIIVNESEQLIKEILVYDIAGNLIANKATVNSHTTRIYVGDEVGYYVVKVITDKAVYSEKVLISK